MLRLLIKSGFYIIIIRHPPLPHLLLLHHLHLHRHPRHLHLLHLKYFQKKSRQIMVFKVLWSSLQFKIWRSRSYGNTGCGVSLSGIQNLIDFCLRVKFSKGYILKRNDGDWRAYKISANFDKINLFTRQIYEKFQK